MSSAIELSIIIVEYKSGEYLKKLLSILPKRSDWEVIVIDNSKNNIGYGAACNKGAEKARGRYLLFMNPDVLLDEKNIERMVSYLKSHPDVGIVGPKYINAENKTERTSSESPTPLKAAVALTFLNKLFPNTQVSKKYWMKDWNRESTTEAEVVSGAALMVRAGEFKVIGKFDPQFFLYWEEIDLCKRMKEYHRDSVYLATAVAHHPREVSMKQSPENLEEVFRSSRRHFFRKHFGLLKMLMLESWFTLTEQWRVISVLLLSLFLRTFAIDHIAVIGDVGRDYLQALNMLSLKSLPILGIPSSIPRFSQGPLNIWFDALSFLLGGVSVYAPVFMAAVLTTVGVGLLYAMVERRLGKNLAFIAALLMAVSPAAITQSRMPFYLFAEPLFLVIFLWKLVEMDRRRLITIFFAVLSFWILFQWELAAIPLLLLIPFAVFHKKLPFLKTILIGTLATIIGLIPQILYDVQHQCAQLCGLFTWAGYRTVAVTGFDGKHGYTLEKLAGLFTAIGTQTTKIVGVHFLELIAVLAVIGWAIMIAFKRRKRGKSDSLFMYSFVGAVLILIGLILHGEPSEAYFPPFIVFFPVLFVYGLSSLPERVKTLGVATVIFIAIINIHASLLNTFNNPTILTHIEGARWIVRTSTVHKVWLKSYDEEAHFQTYGNDIGFMIHSVGGELDPKGELYYFSLHPGAIFPNNVLITSEFGDLSIAKGAR